MSQQRGPDAYTVATTKLAQEWSANRCTPHINAEWLTRLVDDDRFGGMDAMMKVRLLLAALIAVNQPNSQVNWQSSGQLQAVLGKLQRVAAADPDEWVRVMAAAASDFDGRLDLDAVMQQSAVVQETVGGLRQQVQDSANQQLLPPLENLYLQDPPSIFKPDAGHFNIRSNPRVQPLSSVVSYSSVTPSSPAVQAAGRVEQLDAGANGEQHREQQQVHALQQRRSHSQLRAGSSLQPAAGADTGGLHLAGSRAGAAPKQQKIQLLGADEQIEIAEALKTNYKTQAKHGFAVHVRQEQVVGWEPSAADINMQQQHLQQLQKLHQQQESIRKGLIQLKGSSHRAAPAATDKEIDELFDDEEVHDCKHQSSDDDSEPLREVSPDLNILQQQRATIRARSARGLQRHRALDQRMEEQGVPDELWDDGVEDTEAAQELHNALSELNDDDDDDESMNAAQGQQLDRGAAAGPEHTAAAMVKRRRVIADNSEDDN